MYLKVHVYLWALCCFNLMPCVISQWSPDLVFVVFVTTVSNPGQCHFTLDDAFFLVPMGGRGSLIVCGWGCCPWGQKIICKRGLIWRVLSVAHEGRDKTLKVWMRLLPIGQETAYQRWQYHANYEWMDSLTGLCGSVVYLW